MKAGEVRDVIARSLGSQSCAVIFEVQDGLGKGRKTARAADAIAVEFWESRGLEVAGFEIKVERGDWLRELQLKSKAEAHFVRCDRWSLVTPYRRNSEPPIAKIEEIPGPWGWYVVKDGQLHVVKKPPKLVPTVPFDKHFAFALIRAAARYDDSRVLERTRAAEARRDENFTERVNEAAARLVRTDVDPEELKLVRALRESFGHALGWLTQADIVETIQVVRKLRAGKSLRGSVDQARQAAAELEKLAALVETLVSP